MDLGVSGLVSGFDWRSFIDKIIQVEGVAKERLQSERTSLAQVDSAYSAIKSQLQNLQSKLLVLSDTSLYKAKVAEVSDSAIAKVELSSNAKVGEYKVRIYQLATKAYVQGAGGVSSSLGEDAANIVLGEAPLATKVTPGIFTINGRQINVSLSDTLQNVFDKIYQATDGTVQASYDPQLDIVTLTSSSPISLGAANDTSNFLWAFRLYNNSSNTVTSLGKVGVLKTDTPLVNTNLKSNITANSEGKGEFKINGVSITYDIYTDSIASILKKINDSTAGVKVEYDPYGDRFVMINKVAGDIGIGLEDVEGNLLEAMGLKNGTFFKGNNLEYSINGSERVVSTTNVILGDTVNAPGLKIDLDGTVSVPTEFTIKVKGDSSRLEKALNEFISAYNQLQSSIDSYTAIKTTSDGKVQANILAGRLDIYSIATNLRSLVTSPVNGISSLSNISQLRINTSGYNNSLEFSDPTRLIEWFENDPNALSSFFTTEGTGFVARLNTYLGQILGESGSIATIQKNISKQISAIDEQIANQEKHLENMRQQMIQSFIAMEKAQAQMQMQLQFLLQRFGVSSS